MNWNDITAIVTGGTRGIGRELVAQLIAKGATVIATGQSEKSVAEAKAEIPAVTWLVLDQSDDASIDGFVEALDQRPVNLVINNAGVQQVRNFTDLDAPLNFDTDQEIKINLTGPIELTTQLLPKLAEQKKAKVVFVTSGLALAPKRGSPVYCATKAALRSFVKSLRGQMLHYGWPISVVEALPPLVDTDMTKGRGKGKITPENAVRQILNGIARDKNEIYVGASSILRIIMRISPSLGEAIMLKR